MSTVSRRWPLTLGSGVAVVFGIALGIAFSVALERWTNPLPLTVTLVAFNDFHGQLEGGDLRWEGTPVGGVDWLAGHVKALAARDHHHVVVSAGDLVGASPLTSGLFHDEPTIEAMNALGLDFSAVGNHELDEGAAELLRLQRGGCHPGDPQHSCRAASGGGPGRFAGARFQYLAANITDARTGRSLFPGHAIRKFGGVPVAFVGATLISTPSMVMPSAVAGLRFHDEASAVNALIPELRAHGAEAIVLLLHDGGTTRGGCVDECRGFAGSAARIVAELDDEVDLVLTGHTHGAYNCRLPNRAGRLVPVTSAGSFGRLLTGVQLTLDRRSHEVQAVTARNQLVEHAGVQPVPELTRLVAHYRELARPILSRPVGRVSADIVGSRDPHAGSPLAELIADAQLAATRGTAAGGAVVAFMNTDGVRGDLRFAAHGEEAPGVVTHGEAFAVQPFDNALVTLTLSGRQIYSLLEQQWDAGQPHVRVLQVSTGFTYAHDFDFDAPFEEQRGRPHVCAGSVRIDGRPVALDAAYRVTVNAFLAEGGARFSVFPSGSERRVGVADLAALEAYLAARSPLAPPVPGRVRQVDRCP